MDMTEERRQLTVEEIHELREKLLKRREELWEEVREPLTSRLGPEYRDVIQTVREEEDLAQADLQEDIVIEALKSRKAELEDMAKALWLMDRGEYGKCQGCGRWIRFKRLQARPSAIYCLNCEEKREREGRAAAE